VSTLQYYLRGVAFRAGKVEVAQAAESNGAPWDLASQIRNADTDRLDSAEALIEALQVPRHRRPRLVSPAKGCWRHDNWGPQDPRIAKAGTPRWMIPRPGRLATR
jgi:hypothetical protein